MDGFRGAVLKYGKDWGKVAAALNISDPFKVEQFGSIMLRRFQRQLKSGEIEDKQLYDLLEKGQNRYKKKKHDSKLTHLSKHKTATVVVTIAEL